MGTGWFKKLKNDAIAAGLMKQDPCTASLASGIGSWIGIISNICTSIVGGSMGSTAISTNSRNPIVP